MTQQQVGKLLKKVEKWIKVDDRFVLKQEIETSYSLEEINQFILNGKNALEAQKKYLGELKNQESCLSAEFLLLAEKERIEAQRNQTEEMMLEVEMNLDQLNNIID